MCGPVVRIAGRARRRKPASTDIALALPSIRTQPRVAEVDRQDTPAPASWAGSGMAGLVLRPRMIFRVLPVKCRSACPAIPDNGGLKSHVAAAAAALAPLSGWLASWRPIRTLDVTNLRPCAGGAGREGAALLQQSARQESRWDRHARAGDLALGARFD